VLPLHTVATSVVAEMIRRQPASKEKTAFAWGVAVGPAIARATSVELRGATLVVAARDARWASEIERARDVILSRLQNLLGSTSVAAIEYTSRPDL